MPPGSSWPGWLEFLPQNSSPAEIPHPWYSRPRIMGPAAFHRSIANWPYEPQSPTSGGLLLHSTAPVPDPTEPPQGEPSGTSDLAEVDYADPPSPEW